MNSTSNGFLFPKERYETLTNTLVNNLNCLPKVIALIIAEYSLTYRIESMDELYFHPKILEKLFYFPSYDKPEFFTNIHRYCLKPIHENRNCVVIAPYEIQYSIWTLSVLNRVNISSVQTQCLVITSPCELEHDTTSLRKLNSAMRASILKCGLGTRPRDDVMKLKQNPQIVIGSPGRIDDILSINNNSINHLKMIMYIRTNKNNEDGFMRYIHEIQKAFPNVQTCIFTSCVFPELGPFVNDNLQHCLYITDRGYTCE
jgi:translation initiation factor 4A